MLHRKTHLFIFAFVFVSLSLNVYCSDNALCTHSTQRKNSFINRYTVGTACLVLGAYYTYNYIQKRNVANLKSAGHSHNQPTANSSMQHSNYTVQLATTDNTIPSKVGRTFEAESTDKDALSFTVNIKVKNKYPKTSKKESRTFYIPSTVKSEFAVQHGTEFTIKFEDDILSQNPHYINKAFGLIRSVIERVPILNYYSIDNKLPDDILFMMQIIDLLKPSQTIKDLFTLNYFLPILYKNVEGQKKSNQGWFGRHRESQLTTIATKLSDAERDKLEAFLYSFRFEAENFKIVNSTATDAMEKMNMFTQFFLNHISNRHYDDPNDPCIEHIDNRS